MDQTPNGFNRSATDRLRPSIDLGVAQDVVRNLLVADTPQRVLDVIAARGYQGVHPSTAGLALTDDEGRLDLAAGIAVPEVVASAFPVTLDLPVPMVEAVSARVPLWIETGADRDRWYPAVLEYECDLPRSGGFLPLDLLDGRMGVLAVMFEHDRVISEPERKYYDLLADLCAMAVDRTLLRASSTDRAD